MTGTPDPEGDALASYSSYDVLAPVVGGLLPSVNVPALDLTDVSVGPEVDPATGAPVPDGGFTVRMSYADLSDAALQSALAATASTSLVFLFRYVDGYQQASVGAYWDPVQGFRFGRDGYTESQVSTLGTLRTYPGATATPGAVDQATGELVLSVPRDAIAALTGEAVGSRPEEVAATGGSRIYEAVAFTLANPAPLQEAQSYLYQTDNAPSFDFLLAGPAPAAAPGAGGGAGPGTTPPGTGVLPATGGALPLGVLVLVLVGAYGWRRGRTA